MGCGASTADDFVVGPVDPKAHKYLHGDLDLQSQRTAPVVVPVAHQRRTDFNHDEMNQLFDDVERAIYDAELFSDGDTVASGEPSRFSLTYERRKRVLVARVSFGINDDPDQFVPEAVQEDPESRNRVHEWFAINEDNESMSSPMSPITSGTPRQPSISSAPPPLHTSGNESADHAPRTGDSPPSSDGDDAYIANRLRSAKSNPTDSGSMIDLTIASTAGRGAPLPVPGAVDPHAGVGGSPAQGHDPLASPGFGTGTSPHQFHARMSRDNSASSTPSSSRRGSVSAGGPFKKHSNVLRCYFGTRIVHVKLIERMATGLRFPLQECTLAAHDRLLDHAREGRSRQSTRR